MRAKRQYYRDAEYDRRRRNACCVVCGCTDERTRSGGALCARCLTARRQQKDDKQIKLF